MKSETKIGVAILGGGAALWYFMQPGKALAAVRRPNTPLVGRSTNRSPTTGQPITSATLGGLLSLLDKLKGDGKGGGGLSAGAGSGGGGTNASGNGRLPGDNGPILPPGLNGGNFGTYVVNGQPYDDFGRALDDNGQVMPGIWDNTGMGPAGAGINSDGSIAVNPLTNEDVSSPYYGTVIPMNDPNGQMAGWTQLPTGPTGEDLSGGDSDLGNISGTPASDPIDLAGDTSWQWDENYDGFGSQPQNDQTAQAADDASTDWQDSWEEVYGGGGGYDYGSPDNAELFY
jgi:hypothetical protein